LYYDCATNSEDMMKTLLYAYRARHWSFLLLLLFSWNYNRVGLSKTRKNKKVLNHEILLVFLQITYKVVPILTCTVESLTTIHSILIKRKKLANIELLSV